MSMLVFRVGDNINRYLTVSENNQVTRTAFIKSIYHELMQQIDNAQGNLADDDLSDFAKISFNQLLGMYQRRLDFITQHGREFINNGVIKTKSDANFSLEYI